MGQVDARTNFVAHAILILGVAIFAFPIYVALVGSTWDAATIGRGAWRASAWAKNLTDERWAISGFGQGMLPLLQGLGPGGPFDTFTINRGRMVGIDLSRRF
jgi:ABC-type glycerol-3-phosphate transport system permease component